MQNTQGIVKRPIITEKATMLSEQMNRFTFEVIQSANKIEIKNAIERICVQVTRCVRLILVCYLQNIPIEVLFKRKPEGKQ